MLTKSRRQAWRVAWLTIKSIIEYFMMPRHAWRLGAWRVGVVSDFWLLLPLESSNIMQAFLPNKCWWVCKNGANFCVFIKFLLKKSNVYKFANAKKPRPNAMAGLEK